MQNGPDSGKELVQVTDHRFIEASLFFRLLRYSRDVLALSCVEVLVQKYGQPHHLFSRLDDEPVCCKCLSPSPVVVVEVAFGSRHLF
jgi:hypothetical protein